MMHVFMWTSLALAASGSITLMVAVGDSYRKAAQMQYVVAAMFFGGALLLQYFPVPA